MKLHKKKRKLDLFESLIYYFFPLILLLIPSIFLFNELLNEKFNKEFDTSHKASFLVLLIALFFMWFKHNKLLFKTYKTNKNVLELKNEIYSMSEEYNWEIISSFENRIEFRVKAASDRSNRILFPREYKKFINGIITFQSGEFNLNLVLSFENNDMDMTDHLGETNHLRNRIIKRLK
ncbi:hypothetical protein QVZ41_14100 [Wenyingzhuangia sp. chi5]|uniref:Superinfection exclusion protein B n=1 Tax=Wenyingzhuangia gilva TaxID=3057677 RepID=A0ABT8VVM4_9FLAO|nr:hypothetical protein [Wenyingzhuangia sp. chi5]MDO3695980.1 hypothetical protein [Wenyingzhuangia sp. chi5]